MPRQKQERGRPMQLRYPPRTDATVDELVKAFFAAGKGYAVNYDQEYDCAGCGRGVYYPEMLYRDGRCGSRATRPVVR